jgi:hypothetical protein
MSTSFCHPVNALCHRNSKWRIAFPLHALFLASWHYTLGRLGYKLRNSLSTVNSSTITPDVQRRIRRSLRFPKNRSQSIHSIESIACLPIRDSVRFTWIRKPSSVPAGSKSGDWLRLAEFHSAKLCCLPSRTPRARSEPASDARCPLLGLAWFRQFPSASPWRRRPLPAQDSSLSAGASVRTPASSPATFSKAAGSGSAAGSSPPNISRRGHLGLCLTATLRCGV